MPWQYVDVLCLSNTQLHFASLCPCCASPGNSHLCCALALQRRTVPLPYSTMPLQSTTVHSHCLTYRRNAIARPGFRESNPDARDQNPMHCRYAKPHRQGDLCPPPVCCGYSDKEEAIRTERNHSRTPDNTRRALRRRPGVTGFEPAVPWSQTMCPTAGLHPDAAA